LTDALHQITALDAADAWLADDEGDIDSTVCVRHTVDDAADAWLADDGETHSDLIPSVFISETALPPKPDIGLGVTRTALDAASAFLASSDEADTPPTCDRASRATALDAASAFLESSDAEGLPVKPGADAGPANAFDAASAFLSDLEETSTTDSDADPHTIPLNINPSDITLSPRVYGPDDFYFVDQSWLQGEDLEGHMDVDDDDDDDDDDT
jgi:hypothetical protein